MKMKLKMKVREKVKMNKNDVTSTGWLVAMSQRHFAKVMTSFLTKNASRLDLGDEIAKVGIFCQV